ncbi:MAG: DNA polymerase III subunit beta [Deltaproteobacteria bacterium]|nr:DNA polymerase III subunit beta [Deltaproteobacteria bacterium]
MDLLIHRDELVRALARAQGIAEKRSTSPILSSVLLQASGETLRATATDKAITLIADYAATIKTPGEVAVDATNFFQAAKVLRGDIVTLKLLDNGRLEVRSGSAVYNLTTFAATEFPVTPALDQARTMTVDAGGLRRTIDRVHFSVAGDDNRYGLNGAHVEDTSTTSGAVVRFVGTDGNRLSWAQAPYRGELGIGRKMLLPRKGLGEVRKLLEGYEGEVGISFGERAALVQWPGVLVHVRLLEADFPDYRQVLPTSFKRRAILEKDAFREALKSVSILATDASNSVKFQFSSEGLVLSARKLDAGDSKDEVPMEYSGEPIAMGFNARFVGEVLAVIDGTRVSVELGDALSPCIVRDMDDDSALFVVMPVRLD